jgi:hypothetical protein
MTFAISPVMSRIQNIQTRMGVPSTMQVGAQGADGDFGALLSAAFADSSLTISAPADDTATTDASAAAPGSQLGGFAPMAQDMSSPYGLGSAQATTGLPTDYAVLTSSLTGRYGLSGSFGVGGVGGVGRTGGGSTTVDPFSGLFAAAGQRHGVPADLLSAVGYVESRYRVDAVSSAGAEGVMQLMPFVSEELGVDPWDPAQAIDGAARLLRSHFDRFGNWDLALAAYNAGAGAVSRAGDTIPSPGVAEYVRRVNERMMTA